MATFGGIDLGGTKVQAIVKGPGSRVLGSARQPTPRDRGPGAVVDCMAQALREAAADAGIEVTDLDGVGVGSPGVVSTAAGTVERASNLDGFERPFALGASLRTRLGVAVTVANDVDVATNAEVRYGAGRGVGSLIAVFWGTGVGGSVVLDGDVWAGRGGAGEIGHMVVRRNGALCGCGRKGCLEAYAGRNAMEARARRKVHDGRTTSLFEIMREKGKENLSSGVWAKALEDGDELASKSIERAIKALGAGIASAVNLLDVERVIIGGGLGTRFGQPTALRIEAAMLKHLFNDDRPPDLKVVELGDLGGAIGAALLCDRASPSAALPVAASGDL